MKKHYFLVLFFVSHLALDAPKNNRERHIPLVDEVHDMLARRKQTTGFVFADAKNQQLDIKELNRELGNACRQAGIREVTCHVLRHTFASHLVMAGASLDVLYNEEDWLLIFSTLEGYIYM